MFDEDARFVYFNNQTDDLKIVLKRLGLLDLVEAEPDPDKRAELEREASDAVRSAMEEVQVLPINEIEARSSALWGNYHFNLRKTLFTVFELGAKTAIVVAKPTAVLSLLTTVKKLAEVVKKLSDAQLTVIEALQTVIFRKSSITFKEEGASSEEILALFMERRAEAPGDVPELLRLMAEVDGVLTFRMGADERTKYYALVP